MRSMSLTLAGSGTASGNDKRLGGSRLAKNLDTGHVGIARVATMAVPLLTFPCPGSLTVPQRKAGRRTVSILSTALLTVGEGEGGVLDICFWGLSVGSQTTPQGQYHKKSEGKALHPIRPFESF